MTITEKNKAILRFMGIRPRMDGPDRYSWSDTPFYTTIGDDPETVMERMANYAKYHSDWSWLMRAVERVESLSYAKGRYFFLYKSSAFVQFKVDRMNIDPFPKWGTGGGNLKGAIYEAVYQFVVWHNQQQK